MKKFFKNLKKKADNATIAAKIAIDNKRAVLGSRMEGQLRLSIR